MRLLLLTKIFLLIVLCISPVHAAQMETQAEYAYMIDYDTGQVLFEKNADVAMGPSSMTKLMTAYLAFDALKSGGITMETTFPISVKAWKKGGSKMYIKEGDDVSVDDLLQGIIVVSGNDACIALAEGMAGSEELFADDMNAMGKHIGLTGSNFKNASGWPDKEHVMSAKDLVTLSTRLIRDFPEYYHLFSQEYYTYSDIKQRNRNKLLYRDIGVDGLKTGFTNNNGYGIVVSGEQDGRRVVLALNGLKSSKQRIAEGERFIRHGFRDFKLTELYGAGDVVDNAQVWMGASSMVPLVAEEDVSVLRPKRISQRGDYEISVSYEGPISAPIKKGQKLGALILKKDGEIMKEVPLVAGESVDRLGIVGRMQFIVMNKLFGAGS